MNMLPVLDYSYHILSEKGIVLYAKRRSLSVLDGTL